MKTLCNAILIALLIAGASTANAIPLEYEFQYTFTSGEQLTGHLLGTLQGDNDTISVAWMSMVHYSGLPGIALEDSLIIPDPVASLSGALVELVAQVPIFEPSFFLVNSPTLMPNAAAVAAPVVNYLEFELFEPEHWQIARKVSSPGTWLLLLSALLLVNRRGDATRYAQRDQQNRSVP